MQIAIAGKKSETKNYTAYVEKCGFTPLVTLNTGDIAHCQGLILPGGGDITPAFFGEKNHGSKNIDTELDILQLQSFDYCLRNRIPVLGICKGIQLINVGLGGSIYQHFPSAERHCCLSGDQYHNTTILKDSFLYPLYGSHMPVNSAHHQALKELGSGLKAIQWIPVLKPSATKAFPLSECSGTRKGWMKTGLRLPGKLFFLTLLLWCRLTPDCHFKERFNDLL